jgi:hypothetical protein
MTAHQLVRLYPRAWRDRYGEEFVETVGTKSLHPQQVLDIVGGAVDAWVSFQSKTAKATTEGRGEIMVQHWKAICATSTVRYTKRDALISAGVLLAASLVMSAAGILIRRQGYPEFGEALVSLSFPLSVVISMPFAVLKGQPKAAQAGILGFTTLILVLATWFATKI